MLLVGTRRTGKSYNLVKEASESGAVILCHNKNAIYDIKRLAFEWGFKIKEPKLYGWVFDGAFETSVLVDNIDMFVLHHFSRRGIRVLGGSIGVELGGIKTLNPNITKDYEFEYMDKVSKMMAEEE